MSIRLKILNSGYSFSTKVLFALIHAISRQPLPDAAKLVFYRPDFYGAPMKEFTQEAMRGPSTFHLVGGRPRVDCGICLEDERVHILHWGAYDDGGQGVPR